MTTTTDSTNALDLPVNAFNFSVRARKTMCRLGIDSARQLVQYSRKELLKCKNFGLVSLAEVVEQLAAHGLKLKDE